MQFIKLIQYSAAAILKKQATLPVPLHIRNAPTRLMRELDYGKGYRYAHDDAEGLVDQEHHA